MNFKKLLKSALLGAVASSVMLSAPVFAKGPNYLRLPFTSGVPTIDPGLGQDTTSIEVIEQLFLGLTDYHPDTYEVVPELAESWTTNADSTVYTFKLKKGVVWTDGKPVTAHDVVYAIKRNIAPKTASPYAYVMYIIKNAEEANNGKVSPDKVGVKALDDYTVQFELKTPAGFFPAIAGLWTLRPLRKDIIEKYKEKWTHVDNIVSNGSYKLKEWVRDDKMILVKNPLYKIDDVKIPEIRYYIVPNQSTALAMYENGDLDMLSNQYTSVSTPDIPRLKADPIYSKQFSMQPSLCTYYISFNNERPPMDNVLVRKAIASAIDRKLITDRVLRNGWKPATSFVAPPIFGHVADQKVGTAYNPELAKKYLAEAGYPNGKGFPEVIYAINTSEQHQMIAQAIQSLLKRNLNIRVKIQSQEWKVFLKTREKAGSPHIMRDGWCADYMDAHNWHYENMHPNDPSTHMRWKNNKGSKEYIEVTEKAMRSSNPAERKALYLRAEQILNEEEVAAAMLFYYADPTMASPRIKKWSKMPLGGFQIRYWELAD